MATHSFIPRFVLAILIATLPWRAAAQDWDDPWADPADRPPRVDVGISAGVLMPFEWSDLVLLGSISPASGILEQVLVENVRLEPDRKYAVEATYWRGRYGFGVDVGYSRSRLSVGGAPFGPAETVGVRTWVYGVRGAVGLVEYSPRRWIWPYGFVGVGGITYDLARPVAPPLLTFIEHGRAGQERQPTLVVIEDDGREFILGVNQLDLETLLAFSVGAGADFRIPLGPVGIGLRLEASDHVARSPLRLRIRELGAFGRDTHVGFGRVHHLRASAGVVVRIGR